MKRELQFNGEKITLEVLAKDQKSVKFLWQGLEVNFDLVTRQGNEVVLRDGTGKLHHLQVDGDMVSGLFADAQILTGSTAGKAAKSGGGDLTAPMPGKVFKIVVKPGDKVVSGQTLLILEAMKMEHAIKSPKDGTVKKILFKEGDLVQTGLPLAELE